MTNMFIGIPAQNLCDQHLLGLHKELHQEAGTLANHPHGKAVVRGHFIRGQVDMAQVHRRHKEVVREMERRGMNHDSSLDYDIEYTFTGNWFMQNINRKAVENKCDNCEVEV